jgi:hypothetical protein
MATQPIASNGSRTQKKPLLWPCRTLEASVSDKVLIGFSEDGKRHVLYKVTVDLEHVGKTCKAAMPDIKLYFYGNLVEFSRTASLPLSIAPWIAPFALSEKVRKARESAVGADAQEAPDDGADASDTSANKEPSTSQQKVEVPAAATFTTETAATPKDPKDEVPAAKPEAPAPALAVLDVVPASGNSAIPELVGSAVVERVEHPGFDIYDSLTDPADIIVPWRISGAGFDSVSSECFCAAWLVAKPEHQYKPDQLVRSEQEETKNAEQLVQKLISSKAGVKKAKAKMKVAKDNMKKVSLLPLLSYAHEPVVHLTPYGRVRFNHPYLQTDPAMVGELVPAFNLGGSSDWYIALTRGCLCGALQPRATFAGLCVCPRRNQLSKQ